MSSETKVLTRQELYEKIWAVPIHKLAKEFGLSDVGLAKLCRRHAIPSPGRGYWRRIETGQKLRRTPLPILKDPRHESIRIIVREESARQVPRPYADAPRIRFPSEAKPITHPFALRTEKRLAHSKKKDQKGLLISRTGIVRHLSVTPETLRRALSILDVLISALPEHGCTPKWPREKNSSLTVIVEGEELTFSISEVVKGTVHTLTKEDQARQKSGYWWRPPRYDFHPTGRLRLKIESDAGKNLRHQWTDGKHQRLEDVFGQFIAGLQATAEAVKQERANRIRWEQERQEQMKREAELRQQREQYARRAEFMAKVARNWQESRLLEDFVGALDSALKNVRLTEEQLQEAKGLLEWTKHHAVHVNPLSNVLWLLEEFKRATDPYRFFQWR